MDQPTHRHLRLMGGRSNPFQTLVALFVTAIFFMMFQANVLKNLQRSQRMLLNSGSEQHNKGKYSRFDVMAVHNQHAFIYYKLATTKAQSENEFIAMQYIEAFYISAYQPRPDLWKEVNPKFAQKLKQEIGIKVNGTILRGVMKSERKHYLPTKDGFFACLSRNQTVPWRAVNNDYCDCIDGSDEPGTSACKNGRFYCEPEHRFLSSSRVNDGICDCCDGSDEWKGITLPPDLRLPDSDGILRAPCSDVCMDYEHSKLREMNIIREGASAKPPYIAAGATHIGYGEYGPQGEFYKLSQECFVFKSPGYIYEICPYVNATQSGKDVWLIGSGGRLEGSVEKGFTLVMGDGRSDHCPDKRSRKVVITFQCAAIDQIKYVSEKETCVYGAKFDSPAACPDLDKLDST